MNCVTSTKEDTEENARCVKNREERKMWVSKV